MTYLQQTLLFASFLPPVSLTPSFLSLHMKQFSPPPIPDAECDINRLKLVMIHAYYTYRVTCNKQTPKYINTQIYKGKLYLSCYQSVLYLHHITTLIYCFCFISISSKPLKSQGHRGSLGQAITLTQYNTFLASGQTASHV